MSFVHLHNHSEYSVLDGMAKVKDIVHRVEELGLSAHAITDHGTLSGIPEFYWTMHKAGKTPILGYEAYVDEELTNRFPAHITLLAQGERGYRQLVELNNLAQSQFYDRPRITYNQLWELPSDSLICLSGCMSARASKYMAAGHLDVAEAFYKRLRQHFAGKFFMEIQKHQHSVGEEKFGEDQKALANFNLSMASELQIPAVFTNDSHYTNKVSEEVHRALIRMGKESSGKDYRGLEFSGTGFYIKSPEEIAAAIPESARAYLMGTSLAIAKLIGDVTIPELDKTHWHMPSLSADPIGTVIDKAAKLGRLRGKDKRYEERWDHELRVIEEANFATNYLLTLDYVQWAKDQGIKVGPGRGSMVGSLVSYALGITEIDPIRYDLLFERAINPARPSIPDFDVDFESNRRSEVLDYLAQKYAPHILHIGTLGRYSIKGALRSVLSVLDYGYLAINELIKGLELNGVTWEDFDQFIGHDLMRPIIQEYPGLPEMVRQMEGIAYATGTHAAGVVISDNSRPLRFEVPVGRAGKDGGETSAYDMDVLKKMGFVKFDILGLGTLDVIAQTCKSANITLDFASMEFDDNKVFKTINDGFYKGLFQIEGGASIQVIRAMGGIVEFEDIVAMNAIGRPGAIQFLKRFVEWRYDHKKIKYADNKLAPILDKTHGVILYQEQVMQIAKDLAGFTDIRVDDIKEAIKFFRAEVFAEIEPEFLLGCEKNGVQNGPEIYAMIKDFAGYGFNRAHAVAYSAIAYATAWLKTYYPAEFYAAALNMCDKEEYQDFISEARRMNIEFVPPHVNTSLAGFSVLGKRTVQFGINSVAYCKDNAANAIIEARPFISVEDLEKRVPARKCNARSRTNLLDVGAFSGLDGDQPMAVHDRRKKQRELIGVAIEFSDYERQQLSENNPDAGVRVGFLLSEKKITTKKGDNMGFLKFEDGGMDVTLFPQQWFSYKQLKPYRGGLIKINGRTEERDGKTVFIGNETQVFS